MSWTHRFRRGQAQDAITTGSDAVTELRNFQKQHKWDPFLDINKLDNVDEALNSGNAEKQAAVDESLIQEDSPYPEVRASVPPTDEDFPVNTLRAWVIGGLMCTVVASCNVLLSLRRLPLSISASVVQLISYPIGCFWAKAMPEKSFTLFGHQIDLNPGPFNVKEHTMITVMTAAGTTVSYAIDILLAQEIFYHQHFKWGFQILLILSTNVMGLGIAGISRRFLIWPSAMVWPSTLITTTVMHSLHNHKPADPAATHGWTIGRYKFFLIVAACVFVWEWVPQVFATFLQFFYFATWAAPDNVVVNQLFGGQSGLGLLPISFDWNTVAGFVGSPLPVPAFALANFAIGMLFCLVGGLGLYFGGPEYYRYLPIVANQNFDRYAMPYNVSRILTPDYTVNETAYKEYSPILIPATFSLTYAFSFAGLMATLTHTVLYYGADTWRRVRNSKYDEPDVHLKLMRKYKEVPEWWFFVVFVVSFVFGLVSSVVWPTHLPWWAYILCIAIGVVLFIPVGIIQAVTSSQTSTNVLMEMIIGYLLPGRPVAMMVFKGWGTMVSFNGLTYIADMKVGHYMKIPPRSMFAAQAFATIWLSLVQIGTYNYMIGNIKNVCTPHQSSGWTCPLARVFYNSSVIWGVVGPRRIFGAGGVLAWTNYFWLIGFVLPLVSYFVVRKYPRSAARYVIWPVVFSAAGYVPPATFYNLLQWLIVGLCFNYFIRRRYLGWWSQYNYILSAGLDIGAALCGVFIGFIMGFGNFQFPSWWGNSVVETTLDYNGGAVTKLFDLNTSAPIGPETW